jgi:hypothetical protein
MSTRTPSIRATFGTRQATPFNRNQSEIKETAMGIRLTW